MVDRTGQVWCYYDDQIFIVLESSEEISESAFVHRVAVIGYYSDFDNVETLNFLERYGSEPGSPFSSWEQNYRYQRIA